MLLLKLSGAHLSCYPLCIIGQCPPPGLIILATGHIVSFVNEEGDVYNLALWWLGDAAHQVEDGLIDGRAEPLESSLPCRQPIPPVVDDELCFGPDFGTHE